MIRLTEEKLNKLRQSAVEKLRRLVIRYRCITCEHCPLRYTCEHAYDPYNVDGDCLAEK